PALLGMGGNDGRLDFTNNLMQRLVELFDVTTGAPAAPASGLLDSALFATAAEGLVDRAIGQFFPGAAGGANSTRGYTGSSLINPWDFVLMLEGALLFAVAAVRRLEGAGVSQAAAPFAVRAQAAGYASAAIDDESSRGEQWLPLWKSPSRLREVQALMREGRMRTGRSVARNAVDAVRSFARLGTARGVDSFVRFGYIERNGQSNLAVPLGTWSVKLQPEVRLIDEIDPWLDNLRRAAGNDHAPAGLGRIARQLEDDVLTVCREPGARGYWEALLSRLGEAEDELVRRPRLAVELGVQPLPKLSPGWCRQADDGSDEFRIALAIASQRDVESRGKQLFGGVRSHCIPLDVGARWPRFAATSQSLAIGPDQVWAGRDLVDDLAAIVLRRLVRSAKGAGLALVPMVTAPLAAIARFIDGRLDETRIARLIRGLMSLDLDDTLRAELARRVQPDAYEHADAAHGLFRLLWLPASYHVVDPIDDPAALRVLLAGRVQAASKIAVRRLVGRGLRPKLSTVHGAAALGRRVVAALAIPISPADAWLLRTTICAPERGRDVRDGTNPRELFWRTP
ncbi:MAG: type I-U CRISPR-associated protein Csx17, partial [Proteobacteria bacterium]|nr:type I-U CRISPR-associated protein Csx17 [Pseudomonadota bacterium]